MKEFEILVLCFSRKLPSFSQYSLSYKSFIAAMNSFVFGFSANSATKSSTTTALAAVLATAVEMARRFSLRLILMDQSRGFGPKMTPPPGRRGVRLEPRRARPVFFCGKGFRPPPRTSPRVRVEAVPRRLFWRSVTTARWTTARAVSGGAERRSRKDSPTLSPEKLRTGRGGEALQEMERGFLEGKTGKLLDLKELLCVWNWCEEKKMEDDVKESEVTSYWIHCTLIEVQFFW